MELKKSISQKLRMDGRDYLRPGWYFVTLGADYHHHLFGAVKGGVMQANALGRLVEQCWRDIPRHYHHVSLGAWQLMPNHFHGLVRIFRPGGSGLGEVMNMFKGSVTRLWRKAHPESSRHGGKGRIWAPNYYDVICFDAEQLDVRENYILANPKRWALKAVPQGRIKRSRYRGNRALLEQPGTRLALRVSRRSGEAEIRRLQAELACFEGVVFSTFFSPGERACLEALLEGNAGVVWVLPMGMPGVVPMKWTDAFLEGRALWLSAFPDDMENASRESCAQANGWVERFCRPGTNRSRKI